MKLRLDHILTFTTADIDTQLAHYRSAGFVPHAKTARWDPGLRNGFLRFWPEYLELLWPEDTDDFEADCARFPSLGGAACRQLRNLARPYGIGFNADDPAALRQRWLARSYELPDISYSRLKNTPANAPPDFAFLNLPTSMLPGASCFVLKSYYPDSPMRHEVWINPNSSFAIAGVTFVCDIPQARAETWRDVLAPDTGLDNAEGGAGFVLGPHTLHWLSSTAYQRRYGIAWDHTGLEHASIAVIHLLCESLERFVRALRRAGRHVDIQSGSATVYPHRHDGYLFEVEETPVKDYLQRRMAQTRERLTLAGRA